MADYEISSPPHDPVSSLKFFPGPSTHARSTQVLIASWDSQVRLVDATQATPAPLQTFHHDAAVLDTCWISETVAASGSVDRRVRLLQLDTGKSLVLGKHSAPVSRVRYVPSLGILLTASWDRTLGVWDVDLTTEQEPSGTLLYKLTLPDKALAMDTAPSAPLNDLAPPPDDPTLRVLIAVAGRQLVCYALTPLVTALRSARSDGTEILPDDARLAPEWKRESSLKFMVRDVACMPNGLGFATSSVEGRVAVEFFDNTTEDRQAKGYAFKCHRQVVDGIDTVYPVNALVFHPIHGTFASLGGDGMCALWDASAKKRLRQYPRFPSPLSTGAISPNGQLFVLATGAENVEDARHVGPGAGEVGGLGQGGTGNVRIFVKGSIWEDGKPKPQP